MAVKAVQGSVSKDCLTAVVPDFVVGLQQNISGLFTGQLNVSFPYLITLNLTLLAPGNY